MANPFSGLENIGQSYLAGVQLAQQRQYREDAIAQRQEEARVRERYYQELIGERQAQREAQLKARFDQAASMFGQDLVLANGEPDYAASALKRDRRLQEEQIAGAEGELGALYGTQAPLSPEIIASPAYQTGKIRGLAKRLADDRAETIAMIRRGYVPVDQELPPEVISQIEDFSTPDIFSGAMRAPVAPTPRGEIRSVGGRRFLAPAPAAEKPKKAGTVKFTTPGGEEVSIDLTPEAARALQAERLASVDKEPDPFSDIDEAEKELKRLASRGKDVEVNVYEDDQGDIKIRKDVFGFMGESAGLTPDEAKAQLDVLRKTRKEALGMTPSEPAPANRAEAAARARRVTPIGVLTNLPPITQRVRTNALPPVVNSLAPVSPVSPEDLRGLDTDELRQALLEARTGGVDPGQLGLQLRQALQEAGVPTAAGTNSIPLGLIPGTFDTIMRLPRGRAPIDL